MKKENNQSRAVRPVHLLVRLAIIILIAVISVVYSDRKAFFITDQKEPHHEMRWESIYRLTPKTPIDIVVLGNSHVNTGVEPFSLSCALNCTAFDMAPSGIMIADAYYCLKELLTRTTPKLVVVETYLMRGIENNKLRGAALADEFRSFYPRRNLKIKLESLPFLFDAESCLPAWSFTLRNHELLLRNRDLMKYNRDLYEKRHKSKDNSLYLGRYSRFKTGINDSIMNLYETKGPAVDGSKEKISRRDIRYARKIVDLCNEKGIEVMFFTLPMYELHIGNYDDWMDEQAKAIAPTEKNWYNMQRPYASGLKRDCFEPTYDKNQHLTIQGSIVATYKLAHYISDHFKDILPDRSTDSKWVDLFYGKDGYFENHTPREDDPDRRLIAKDIILENEHIIDFFQDNRGWLFLKLDSDTSRPDDIYVLAELLDGDEKVIGILDMSVSRGLDPVNNKLYVARLRDNVQILNLVGFYEMPVTRSR